MRKFATQLVHTEVENLDITEFNLLEQVKTIFTNAREKYGVKVFKCGALQCLLKLVDIYELEQTLLNTEKITQKGSFYGQLIGKLFSNINGSSKRKKIAVRGASKIDFIEINQIVYCSAESNYTNILTASDKTITSSKPLKYFDEILEDNSFFRVSKSHLINIDYVDSYKKNLEKIELNNGHNVNLSRRRKKEFLEFLNSFIS